MNYYFGYFEFRKEVNVLAITSYIRGINLASFVFTERTTLFVTIVAYVLQGNIISADKVFSMAQYFNILQLTMAILYPRAIGCAAEAKVSIMRIEVFNFTDNYEEQEIFDLIMKCIIYYFHRNFYF